MLTLDRQLDVKLQQYAMSVESFAALASLDGIRGASRARLHESFRSGRSLPNHVAIELWNLWLEIEAICKEAAPIKIDLRDAQAVHGWLRMRRAQEFYFICVTQQNAENSDVSSK